MNCLKDRILSVRLAAIAGLSALAEHGACSCSLAVKVFSALFVAELHEEIQPAIPEIAQWLKKAYCYYNSSVRQSAITWLSVFSDHRVSPYTPRPKNVLIQSCS